MGMAYERFHLQGTISYAGHLFVEINADGHQWYVCLIDLFGACDFVFVFELSNICQQLFFAFNVWDEMFYIRLIFEETLCLAYEMDVKNQQK